MLGKFEIQAIPNGGGNVEYNITLQTVLNYLGVARISSVMYKIAGKDANEKSEVTPG